MNTMEDVFDESVKEEEIGGREWQKSKAELLKEGFRDGVEQGQESRLQDGFNTGYKMASIKLYQLAKLRGEISAILTSNYIQENKFLDKTKLVELNQLTEDISVLEKIILKPDKHQIRDVLAKERQGHTGRQGQGHTWKQGQGHTGKQQIETFAQDDKFKECGDGCDCAKKAGVKCFHGNDEATAVGGETIQLSSRELYNSTTGYKHHSSGIKSENILLQNNFDSKIIEFRNRLINIYKIS